MRNVYLTLSLVGSFLVVTSAATAQTPTGAPTETTFHQQNYNRPEACLPCHQRQFDELRSSVKSGYRNVSPLFNGLETSANFLNGGLLRPVYKDSTKVNADLTPLNTNMFTSPVLTEISEVRAGFCLTCHNAHVERNGDDPTKREVAEIATVTAKNPNGFHPEAFRPLRDYHMVDSSGKQSIPPVIGAQPAPGTGPSLGAAGLTCDVCHNVAGADINRSFHRDGFANTSILINQSVEKVGPFPFPVGVKNDFHIVSNNKNKIAFLRSGAFCNACHDVRVPLAGGDLQNFERNDNPGGQNVGFYRLENLSTEWQIGAYNSTNNPFGKVIRCQDCHMSLFPFGGNSTYQVGDLTVTTATPGVFSQDYAAVPGISTDENYPLPKRAVVNHYFTGVDVPLLAPSELQARLGSDYPDPYQTGNDAHGVPLALATRRMNLLQNAARISLVKTDTTAKLGQPMTVRAEAVALTGHRFPAGFSQERTTYIQMSVKDDNGFLVYQSGYVVDKPHPDTKELQPDGNLDDEDLEHVHAVVDGGQAVPAGTYVSGNALSADGTNFRNGHLNTVFELGPDNGPDSRVYEGSAEGLVLFRNELTRIFGASKGTATPVGRFDGVQSDGSVSVSYDPANPPKTLGKAIIPTKPHYEETFSAAFANTVDNFRSLQPLTPRTFRYEITLPSQAELQEMGIASLKSPLHVHAQINYLHFPPLFIRFLAKTTGPNGPGGDKGLVSEATIDNYVKVLNSIASDDFTVQVTE